VRPRGPTRATFDGRLTPRLSRTSVRGRSFLPVFPPGPSKHAQPVLEADPLDHRLIRGLSLRRSSSAARPRFPARRHLGAVEIGPEADAVPPRCPHRNASAAAARAWRGHPGWLVGPGGACEAVPVRSWGGIVARGNERRGRHLTAVLRAARRLRRRHVPPDRVRSALHPDPRGQTSRRSRLGPWDQK
jgi:hypothetical protein